MKIEYRPMKKRAEFQSNYRKENIKLKREIEGLKEANAQLRRELEKVNNTRTVKIGSSKEIDYGLKLKELEKKDLSSAMFAGIVRKKKPNISAKDLYFEVMGTTVGRLFSNFGKDPQKIAEELSIRTGVEITVEDLLDHDNYNNFNEVSEANVVANFTCKGIQAVLTWSYNDDDILSVNGEIYED